MEANQEALDRDLNDHWALDNTPTSWSHFTRENLATHYQIQDEYMIGDMYQES